MFNNVNHTMTSIYHKINGHATKQKNVNYLLTARINNEREARGVLDVSLLAPLGHMMLREGESEKPT